MHPEPSVSRTAVKSAVDWIVLPQLGVTVQFFAAGAVDDVAEEIRCGWCGVLFYVHRSCFRGHAYCPGACRREGHRRRCRRARAEYRKSVEAREDNRDRNREYRARSTRAPEGLAASGLHVPERLGDGHARRAPRRQERGEHRHA